jgi:hypothetical protein
MLVIVVCRCKQHAQLQFSLICLLLVRKVSCGGTENGGTDEEQLRKYKVAIYIG